MDLTALPEGVNERASGFMERREDWNPPGAPLPPDRSIRSIFGDDVPALVLIRGESETGVKFFSAAGNVTAGWTGWHPARVS